MHPSETALVPIFNSGPQDLELLAADNRDSLAAAWLLAQDSDNTRKAYLNDIRAYFAWADQWGVDVLTARRLHIDGYREHLTKGDHIGRYTSKRAYTSTTIARKLTAVSSFYRYCAQEKPHLVPLNPAQAVKRPRIADESTTPGLTLPEAQQLIQAAGSAPLDNALLRLLLGTGIRVSEACRADTGDLGSERGHVTITVTRKGGARQKIPIPQSATEALYAYLGGRSGPLFVLRGERMKRQQIDHRLARIAQRAGLKIRLTPHVLRHACATLALDAGATLRDVQYLLGHKDPRTTNRYDRARDSLDRSAVHVLEKVLTEELA